MPDMSRNSNFVGSVRLAVGFLLPNGRPAIDRVARFLGVHPRTLQRRLAEAGTTYYSQIVSEVRNNTARDLIGDKSLTLRQVAAILGYSNTSHFTRAFVSRTGITPRNYRLAGKRQEPTDNAKSDRIFHAKPVTRTGSDC